MTLSMDVPFEIWVYIASFIPPDELQKLHAVNHAFFIVAMEEWYKSVHFCDEVEMIPIVLSRLKYVIFSIPLLHLLHLKLLILGYLLMHYVSISCTSIRT